ncbi:Acetylxylan esterase precursor [Rubripirellula tenax]|uniref:Acetylxylan esterase n=1 Tax=Rubripirellula tenax TaxID=2528015 RepID=A0A5C6EYK4_9BACT|nr:alpha/beta hydrolase [Rubripirellula tenax]TWU54733.1 Acetylxylan esterase precursor [Rubripirellula tenax]
MIKQLLMICTLFASVSAFGQVPKMGGGKKYDWTLGYEPDKIIEFYTPLPDVDLKLHLFFPEDYQVTDKRPCIIFFFGGSWVGGDPDQFYGFSKYMASRGMVAISAQYRNKKYNKAIPRDCVEDGREAVRYVRQHAVELGVDPDRIAAGGGSAGGHVAAAVAMCTNLDANPDSPVSSIPNALVLFNPVYNNGSEGFGYKQVKDYWEDISPFHNIREGQPPTVSFFGSKDKHTSVSQINAFQAAMEKAGNVSVSHIYEDQGHGFFHISKGGRNLFEDLLIKSDAFLVEQKFLSGENRAKEWTAMAIEHYENTSLAQRKTAKKKPTKKPTKKSAKKELVDVSEGRPVVRLWPLEQVGGPANRLKHEVTRRGTIRYENVKDPHLVLFSAQRAEPNPAVVYCPGGAYQHQTPKPEIIEWLNECGVTVFMLKYRASGDREAAFEDVQRAMRLVRQNAKQWNIDPNQLGVVGSSAGGHLVLRLSQHHNQRAYPEIDDADQQSCEPDFVITGSAAYLCEKGTQEIVEEFPMSGKIAPTFMVYALNDKRHGHNSVVYEKALRAVGGTTEIMASETGGHPLKGVNWFTPCEEWLKAQGIKISPVK